jgi:hypothetical protein
MPSAAKNDVHKIIQPIFTKHTTTYKQFAVRPVRPKPTLGTKEYRKMSSRQKRKQARLNGAKAAGTKSPAGIQRSSVNALKHGLTSKAIVLTNESQTCFDELHLTYVQDFSPQSGVEMDLIDQMVASQWRLRRIWRMQNAALDLKMDMQEAEIKQKFHQIDQPTRLAVAFTAMANEERSLDVLLRYETAYTRMYQRAMSTLMRLRCERAALASETDSTTSSPAESTETELRIDPDPAPESTVNPVISSGSISKREPIQEESRWQRRDIPPEALP